MKITTDTRLDIQNIIEQLSRWCECRFFFSRLCCTQYPQLFNRDRYRPDMPRRAVPCSVALYLIDARELSPLRSYFVQRNAAVFGMYIPP